MSRKDLSRTVIEGGRYYRNSYDRRASHGVARMHTRAWLDQLADDPEEADATDPRPPRRVPKAFRDKLGPALRWLESQVGRPWNAVFSDLMARFDTRTVAGRHVVHDHMLEWVWRGDVTDRVNVRNRYTFVIDAYGILRRPDGYGRSRKPSRREVLAWAAGRVAAKTHRGWWWFRREPLGAACPDRWRCAHRTHHTFGYLAYHGVRITPLAAMSTKQIRYLARLIEVPPNLVIANPWRR